MAATFRGERHDVELGDGPFDLATADAARARSRLPEVLVGTLLVALFALAGAWFYATSTVSVGYLALREDVARGEIIERTDLTVYELTTDAPIRALRAAAAVEIVGKVALADLATGTLITAEQFADTADIPPGSGVVGLDLDPGEFPSFSLRPGDRVRVVRVATGPAGTGGDPEVLADGVEVVEVVEGGGRGRFVSLSVDLDIADRVAVAAASNEVRLIQVSGG